MNANPEIDILLQAVLALQSKEDLNHHEEKELHDKKMSLLEASYKMTFSENEDRDSELYWKAFEEIIKKYCEKNDHDFVTDTKKRYKVKYRGKLSESLEEKSPDEAKLRRKEIRSALRNIALEHGMESKAITAALKFNMLNFRRVEQFLVSNFGYSAEEVDEFNKNVFSKKFTDSLNSENEDGTIQNRALIKASEDNIIRLKSLHDISFDEVLDISYDSTKEKGKVYKRELKGYWTVQFVQTPIDKEKAEKKKKHIMLNFYEKNIRIYNDYEDEIVVNALNNDANKSSTEIAQLRRRVTRKVHREIMPIMSAKLKLQPDTWRKKYVKINKDLWLIINDIHLFRE